MNKDLKPNTIFLLVQIKKKYILKQTSKTTKNN